jgi:hypothetical protein
MIIRWRFRRNAVSSDRVILDFSRVPQGQSGNHLSGACNFGPCISNGILVGPASGGAGDKKKYKWGKVGSRYVPFEKPEELERLRRKYRETIARNLPKPPSADRPGLSSLPGAQTKEEVSSFIAPPLPLLPVYEELPEPIQKGSFDILASLERVIVDERAERRRKFQQQEEEALMLLLL